MPATARPAQRGSRLAVLACVVFASALAGCGHGGAAPPAPPPIPAEVVPSKVAASGGLTVQPNTSPEISAAFRSVGPTSLVRDGGVWEVRSGDLLVGALELATLRTRADTRKEADRLAIRRQVFAGEPTELDFFGVPVYEARDGQRTIFLWYGRQVFGVLQLKGTDLDPDAVANELVTVILQDKRWPGLPPDDFEL